MRNIVLNSERFGSRVVFLSECESTNDVALQYLRESKSTSPIVFITDHQTKGRGQRGNIWVSERGTNLTFSVLWYPNLILASKQFILNQIASLAVAKTIIELGVVDVKVKWPNDVFVGTEKIAGILIENLTLGKYIKASVIGIGVNFNQKPIEGINMTSLSELVELKISREALCEKMIYNLDFFLDAVDNNTIDLNAFYESNMYKLEIPSVFKNQNGDIFVGKIVGVDSQGLLKVQANDGLLKFSFKEVSILNSLE